jgi:putative FmdB family regulatory protein
MIYIFRCRKCGEVKEYELGMDDPRPTGCSCGGTLVRKFTSPNVVYRGSGFYNTDKRLTPVHPLDYDSTVHTPADLKG